ncbi:MAG: hypothetical protein A3K19_00380 [Lentisphaerae bacterium RIFOXYB12_FULL_65_16]|nr:MAG: hypothetical protein A3K18_31545 [Lentisphaerae bacterium RIFOXYA12_64_32]OGV85329.1 MAG: hypothetical protein A3K19_00380 [Lentisphaerae bacterium RIFOXYB12_FULL_65_16]
MKLHSWLATSLVRHYPATPVVSVRPLSLDVARNERFSFQVGLRLESDPASGGRWDYPVEVKLEAEAPEGWTVRVRRVGYVPMRHLNTSMNVEDADGLGHIPGYVPDPLFDETAFPLPVNETHAFWFTVTPATKVEPGAHTLTVRILPKDQPVQTQKVKVCVHDVSVRPRRDFRVMQWFYNDAILDFHDCAAFDERYWGIVPNYFRNLTEHGQDVVYAPVFTPPLDGVKRPSQLLNVKRTGRDKYRFDWRDVKRYVDLAASCGVRNFEWTHLFTQWGVKCAIRIYENQGADEKLLWTPDTGATSDTYRAFLSQFLPEFHNFLKVEKLLKRSYFHVSDEPHGAEHQENYRKARAVLRELAPWMKVMDALSEIEFGRLRLTDMPVPSIGTALNFVKEGIPCWCYYCCGPRGRYLNRLLDTPLAKIRMNGWLFYRWPFQGFLHWGYNYWYKSQTRTRIDPFSVQDGMSWPGWAYGDTFMVYPGADGPIDSMRWEVFADSMQDYALLQTLDVERDAKLLQDMKSFEDFPKSADWVARTRRKLLTAAAKA